MSGCFVGPMPVAEFLKEFLPPAPRRRPVLKGSFRKIGQVAIDEDLLISAIQDAHLCDNFTFCNTSQVTEVYGDLKVPGPQTSIYENRSIDSPLVAWPQMELYIEKNTQPDAPFASSMPRPALIDPKDIPFEAQNRAATYSRKVMKVHAMEAFHQQFRAWTFSICWTPGYVRLIRWDCSGAVVTRPLNMRRHSRLFAEFLWRFNHMTREQRGHDPSVAKLVDTVAPADASSVYNDFKALLDSNGLCMAWGLNLAGVHDLVRIPIRDESTATERVFVAPRVVTHSGYRLGRNTMDFVAYDVQQHRVVFLKDTWRIDAPCIMKETEVYRTLAQHRVPHIAPVVVAGDVAGQKARSQEYEARSWVWGRPLLTPYQHTRLVLDIVARPLQSFESDRVLCSVIRDACEAHSLAYSWAKLLHGDVTGDNILIDNNGHGVLTGWDIIGQATAMDVPPVIQIDAGSFQAAALNRERCQSPCPMLHYDLESFFWVLICYALRHAAHAAFDPLDRTLFHLFEHPDADYKIDFLTGGMHYSDTDAVFRGDFFRSERLGSTILELKSLFTPFYVHPSGWAPPIEHSSPFLEVLDRHLGRQDGWGDTPLAA